jgi:hypothetical protein
VLPVPDEADGVSVLVVLVVVVLVPVVVDVVGGGALLVGTVSVGAPAVFAWGEPPPPQAETPTASATPAQRAARELVRLVRRVDKARSSGPEGVHPTPAVRAIVQVLLSELVAPIAESEILDRPRQLRRRRRQWEQHGHHLELFAGLAVNVRALGHRLEYYLAARRGRPQPVLLIVPHRFDPTSGSQRHPSPGVAIGTGGMPPRHHRLLLG